MNLFHTSPVGCEMCSGFVDLPLIEEIIAMFGEGTFTSTDENIEAREAPKRLRPYLEGLGIRETGPDAPTLDMETGADLYIGEFFPDDIHLMREHIAMNIERADAEDDVSEAAIVVDATLLRIMLEFFDAEGRKHGLESEDFHIHQDAELREYVKKCMRDAVEAELHETVTDLMLEAHLGKVQGFPPYSYVDMEGGLDDVEDGEESERDLPAGALDAASFAIATTGLRQAA